MLNNDCLRRYSLIGVVLLSTMGLAACEEEAGVGEIEEEPAVVEEPAEEAVE